jgi:hypothetical protein
MSFLLILYSIIVCNFQDKLDDSACKILADYQTATVTLLALMSAATGDVSKCAFYSLDV